MIFSDAVDVVGVMLRGYGKRAEVTASYVATLAEVLARFPRCVAERAGDPERGVPGTTRFIPTPADVVKWCEAEVSWMRDVVARDDREQALRREMRERAEVQVRVAEQRKSRPSLDEIYAQHGRDFGIQVEGIEAAAAATHLARLREANERLRERVGQVPAGGGLTVTRALIEIMRAKPAPVASVDDPRVAAEVQDR